MPLRYPRRTVFFNRLLEWLVFFLFWPWLRILQRYNEPLEKWIVLVEPFGMGDALSLSVMLDLLRKHLADYKICLWLKQENTDLYADDDRVARVETAPFPWSRLSKHKGGNWNDWLAVWVSAKRIRALRPALGFDTRSEIRNQILLALAGCRRRIGYLNYLNTNVNMRGLLLTQVIDKPLSQEGKTALTDNGELPAARAMLHRYDLNYQLVARFLNVTPSPLVFPTFGRKLAADSDQGDKENTQRKHSILLHPGARWEFNRWPQELWAELIVRLRLLAGVSVELIGAPADDKTLREINDCVGASINYRTTPLPRLKHAIAKASLVICMDSGPMHMADTMSIPVLALFGPGDVELWHPRGLHDRWLHVRYPCNPCLQKKCLYPTRPCICAISLEDVMRTVCQMLGSGAVSRNSN